MNLKRFKTFEGVFTPCILSILGVIMYLRLGWVVGTVGLAGVLFIIFVSNLITLFTALSMSSVVTNIRIGAGGAFSIIAKSLGIEAGGAIGIPLYLSQSISVAFYIIGFVECWKFIFPGHSVLLVALIAWGVLFVITLLSAKLAFKIQYFILTAIVLSLISIFIGQEGLGTREVEWVGGFSIENLLIGFSIFFPAVTGILAGASMSGELVDAKKSIPTGTLSAIGVSSVLYLALAYWLTRHVAVEELVSNQLIVIELGRWSWMVVAGIMGATISSALNMFVGAPRVLQALGTHRLVPFSTNFAQIDQKGEPRTAILMTSFVALLTILLGSLDKIAGLLTMFFLITYGMINLIVFIEQSMGIPSFRPTFRVPRIVAFLGALGCAIAMFLLNPLFSFIAVMLIGVMYLVLVRKQVGGYAPNVRSGLLLFIAEKFAQAASALPYYPKIWKPNVLIPIKNNDDFERMSSLVRDVVLPSGRVNVFKVNDQSDFSPERNDELREEMKELILPLKEKNLFVECSVVNAESFLKGAVVMIQALKSLSFPPNTVMYVFEREKEDEAEKVIQYASGEGLGVVLVCNHLERKEKKNQGINLWIRQKSPNVDLSILMALQLEGNWQGKVRIVQIVPDEERKKEALQYLNKLKKVMRLSERIDIHVIIGVFPQALSESPPADINIFGMAADPDFKGMKVIMDRMSTTVLFLKDSEHESALA